MPMRPRRSIGVDGASVFICGVPDLGSKVAAALAAPDFPRENAHAAVSPAFPCASLHLPLHHLEHGSVDDGGRLCSTK